MCGRRWGGENCRSQQSRWFKVPWSHGLSAGSVAPDQMCGKLARLLSAATALLAAGTLENGVQFLKYLFSLEVSMKTPTFVRAAAYKPLLSTPRPAKPAAPELSTPRPAKSAAPK